jgi:hypothetical protein
MCATFMILSYRGTFFSQLIRFVVDSVVGEGDPPRTADYGR